MVWTRYRTSLSPAYLALTFAYAFSGKLALLLAVPPGYASPVFPPAGIAVAAMLISGWASLPWNVSRFTPAQHLERLFAG